MDMDSTIFRPFYGGMVKKGSENGQIMFQFLPGFKRLHTSYQRAKNVANGYNSFITIPSVHTHANEYLEYKPRRSFSSAINYPSICALLPLSIDQEIRSSRLKARILAYNIAFRLSG